MNNTTNICGKCHVSILAETVLSTGGLCMPCFKSANNGWTPYDNRYHKSNHLSSIANRWKEFQQMKFPRSLGGKDIAGVCVSYLDSNIAGCISSALSAHNTNRILNNENTSTLRKSVIALEEIVAVIQGGEKSYFEELLWLAKSILNKCENQKV